MAELLLFPPARRQDLVQRQAHYAATLKPGTGERHVVRQVEVQRDSLKAKGLPTDVVDEACAELATAIFAKLAVLRSHGGHAA